MPTGLVSMDTLPFGLTVIAHGTGSGSLGTQNSESGVIMSNQTGLTATGLIPGAGSVVNVIGNVKQTFFQVGRGETATFHIDAGGSRNPVDFNLLTDPQIDRNPVLVVGGSETNILPKAGGTLTTDTGYIRVKGL